MSKLKILCQAMIVAALAILPLPAFASSQLSIARIGDGVYVVRGTLEKVGGIQADIIFDPTTLTAPSVVFGGLSGAMMEKNVLANRIKIAIISPNGLSGNVDIATITFKRTGKSPVKMPELRANAIDVLAQNTPVEVSTSTPETGGKTNGDTDTGSPTGDGTTGGGYNPYVVGGTITYPPADGTASPTEEAKKETASPAAEPEKQERHAEAPVAVAQAPTPAEAEATASAPQAEPAQPVVAAKPIESVLEKFRLFTGEKTAANYLALFTPDTSLPFTQSPAVAIADGKGIVRVKLSKLNAKKTPNFALKSARFVSMSRVAEGEWEVVLVPESGAVDASVTVMSEGAMQEYPLTVAPKAETADFGVFLKQRGTEAAPKFDLNGDGKRDYLDDYIFTANFLVKAGAKSKP